MDSLVHALEFRLSSLDWSTQARVIVSCMFLGKIFSSHNVFLSLVLLVRKWVLVNSTGIL